MIELYKNIKNLRESKGLSQDKLAKMTGYTSRSSIAKIEKGEVDLTRSKIVAFAKALDTTPAYLMGWEQVDSRLSGKEASSEVYDKFKKSVLKFHGKQKELNSLYEELSPANQDRVLTYSKNLLTNQQMEEELEANAAHERTDIDVTEEMIRYDDDIMDDENF